MDGKYNIPVENVRALAIQCHALDLQFDALFNQETICGYSDQIFDAYNRLMSTLILNLAINIRVSLNDEDEYTRTDGGITNCGLFENGAPKTDGSFSIKDICDKLIHADQISKPIEEGVAGACWELKGTHHKEAWDFGLSIQIFCEYILKWLEEIDGRRTEKVTETPTDQAAFETPKE